MPKLNVGSPGVLRTMSTSSASGAVANPSHCYDSTRVEALHGLGIPYNYLVNLVYGIDWT